MHVPTHTVTIPLIRSLIDLLSTYPLTDTLTLPRIHSQANSEREAKAQAEFDELLHAYAEESGITKDDIEEELAEAEKCLVKLYKQNRHHTPKGQRMQRRVQDLKRLVELRDTMVTPLLAPLAPYCFSRVVCLVCLCLACKCMLSYVIGYRHC